MIVLVEIYLRLEDRLLAAGNGNGKAHHQFITDDNQMNLIMAANLTQHQVCF